MSNTKHLPKYKSHKIVRALKIKSIENQADGTALVVPELTSYAPFIVDNAYITKHDPQPDGYYVTYEDGYESWSPKDAFEKGYLPDTEGDGFDYAVGHLRTGHRVSRASWPAGTFIFKQIPAEIGPDIIPKMTSVPPSVKEHMLMNETNLKYTNQIGIVSQDGTVNSWSPTVEDIFSDDWIAWEN